MKTTLDLPDALFRRAKSAAAERGIPFRALVSEALTEKLSVAPAKAQPWMKSFGALSSLHKESARIERLVAQEFNRIEPEDRL
jgi:hypothetical protein